LAKKARVYDGTAWQELASAQTDLTAYSTTAQTTAGFRNAIINGDFRINQRAFTSTTTNGTYGFDRWVLVTNNGTCTYSTQAFTVGNAISGYEPINHARMVTSGQTLAGAYSLLVQKIEDVRTFAGQTITISFWAKATSGTPKVAVETEQYFGAGGSPSANVTTYAGQATLSTSWNRYSVTVAVPSISGKTLGTTAGSSFFELNLWTSAGTDFNARTNSLGIQSTTIDFWGVQVEAGSVATPFEQRPIGTELALCQRYYYKSPYIVSPYVIFNSGNVMSGMHLFPVTMRAVPSSITYYDAANTVNKISIANAGGSAQNNITPPNALNILNSGWNFGAGGMGGTTGNNGNIMLNSYEANAEL
jgi:hypothetical protein